MAHSRAMDISGTQLRVVRAALFTALVVTLSAASHVLLSQVPLPLTVVGALVGLVFAVAYALVEAGSAASVRSPGCWCRWS